jgi:TatD DNase family protein
VPLRGKRNEPANVVHTAATLAALHGIELAALAEQTTRNARRLFGLSADEGQEVSPPSSG